MIEDDGPVDAMTDHGRIPLHLVTDSISPAHEPQAVLPLRPRDDNATDLVSQPVGWSDPLTGTDGPDCFWRVASVEEARIRRYHRSATIAMVTIDGLEVLAGRWGRDTAREMFVKLARVLAREIRSSDFIARIEPTRFGVLLTETDEVAAINFVERARSACDAQRGLAADVVRVGFGWASLSATEGLAAVLDLAERRLAVDLASSS